MIQVSWVVGSQALLTIGWFFLFLLALVIYWYGGVTSIRLRWTKQQGMLVWAPSISVYEGNSARQFLVICHSLDLPIFSTLIISMSFTQKCIHKNLSQWEFVDSIHPGQLS